MIIACDEINRAFWAIDAQDDFRTLVISGYDGKEEKLRFRLDVSCIYLYSKDGRPYRIGTSILYSIISETLIPIADTDNVEDAINEIMIALL